MEKPSIFVDSHRFSFDFQLRHRSSSDLHKGGEAHVAGAAVRQVLREVPEGATATGTLKLAEGPETRALQLKTMRKISEKHATGMEKQ